MNILYADDSPTCIFLVKSFLNEYNIKIDIVENGQSAINKIKNHQYDIIITDIQMPIKSGIDVVNYVKKNNINIPVIALTSFATTEEMKKFKSYGFDDYITKPFKKNILIQSMYNVMEKKI
jgi:CheY-like chemotaxis protein